jgi:hypothetical protein
MAEPSAHEFVSAVLHNDSSPGFCNMFGLYPDFCTLFLCGAMRCAQPACAYYSFLLEAFGPCKAAAASCRTPLALHNNTATTIDNQWWRKYMTSHAQLQRTPCSQTSFLGTMGSPQPRRCSPYRCNGRVCDSA